MKTSYLKRIWITFLAISIFFGAQSCKDKKEEVPAKTEFAIEAPDALVWEHTEGKYLTVKIISETNTEFSAYLSDVPEKFGKNHQHLFINTSQSKHFELYYNQFNASPESHTCQLTVHPVNDQANTKTKNIQLVYAPNCIFDFRNHTSGEITYVINQLTENKAINCSYNMEGKLVVNNLTLFQIILDADCENGTVTMKPLTHMGLYKTGNGTIQGNAIHLNIYDNGSLSSQSQIKL